MNPIELKSAENPLGVFCCSKCLTGYRDKSHASECCMGLARTPKDYIRVRNEQQAIIASAERKIEQAEMEAKKYVPKKENLRPATAEDIVPDAVIWHQNSEGGNEYHWSAVSVILTSSNTGFNGYLSEDGEVPKFHTLYNAFVEVA